MAGPSSHRRAAQNPHPNTTGSRARARRNDVPVRARTSMPTSTLKVTPRHSSGGRRKTWLQRPCCCVVAQRQLPLRSGECDSSKALLEAAVAQQAESSASR
jgi:hypothetical protein